MEPLINSLEGIARAVLDANARRGHPLRVVIAPCGEKFLVRAAVLAAERGLTEPVLVGDMERTDEAAAEAGVDASGFTRHHEPDPEAAVMKAMELYRNKEAELVMKGRVSTAVVLKAVLNKERGMGVRGLLSHVSAFQLPGENRLRLLTDAAVNIAPTLQRKVDIVRNGLVVARALGMERPRAALLAATEKVNYPAMPATLDADVITKMAAQGEFGDARVQGPLSLDLAVSPGVAETKGVGGEVAGQADLLVAPNIETGNAIYKCLTAILGVPTAGVVVGAAAPIVMASRGDNDLSKYYAMAVAAHMAAQEYDA